MENERKIVKMAQNNPEAFGLIYDEYYTKIFKYIYYRVGNKDVAEDLTSETFFQALKNLWRYKFMMRPFASWLYKIAMTQIALYYREAKKYCALSLEECPDIIHTSLIAGEMQTSMDSEADGKKIVALLKELKIHEQDAIILKYFEEKSMEEIASILHVKINTVKSHLHRGLKKLQIKLQEKPNLVSYESSYRKQVQGNGSDSQRRSISIQ